MPNELSLILHRVVLFVLSFSFQYLTNFRLILTPHYNFLCRIFFNLKGLSKLDFVIQSLYIYVYNGSQSVLNASTHQYYKIKQSVYSPYILELADLFPFGVIFLLDFQENMIRSKQKRFHEPIILTLFIHSH